jgi:hypothetical protein
VNREDQKAPPMIDWNNGWWAEHTDDDSAFPWVPTLQTEGCCFSLPIRFAAEEECIDWIKSHVIGVGFLEPLGG